MPLHQGVVNIVICRIFDCFRISILYVAVLTILTGALLTSCGPEVSEVPHYDFSPDVRDTIQQRLLDFQDRQLPDSLLSYFDHPDPTLRYRAALAFGSFRDSTVMQQLSVLLDDVHAEVRVAAAYALGQTGVGRAEPLLVSAFRQNDSTLEAALSNAAILEALGKTGTPETLRAMSTTTTYLPTDTQLVTGQARGIYRFALRGITDPTGTSRMVDIVCDLAMPPSARLMAANYLLRAQGISTENHVDRLIGVAESETDPLIRMCLVVGLAKARTTQARQTLRRIFIREQDYRVRCNILRALRYFPYADVHEIAFQALDDANVHVALTAATYLLEHGTAADAVRYRSVSRGQYPWEVKTTLYAAANRYMGTAYAITKANMYTELRTWYDRTQNPYESAAILSAYAQEVRNYSQIPQMGFRAQHPAVRTAAVEALGSILRNPEFARVYGAQSSAARNTIAGYLLEAIRGGDVAMIAVAAGIIADPASHLHEAIRPRVEVLEDALIALDLPAHIETYDALAACLASLRGETYRRQPPAFNNPPDWSVITTLPGVLRAEVVTTKGSFVIELWPHAAPATVANFKRLTHNGFYHGKNFHRVVPNFVIQGGCPRGDGYGSLDYSIRSELSPVYYDDEGYVGMASAGNHTEGTQWFVTHSPTPHLDGNYTIFGKVVSGMEVVHAIRVGDEIMEVKIE